MAASLQDKSKIKIRSHQQQDERKKQVREKIFFFHTRAKMEINFNVIWGPRQSLLSPHSNKHKFTKIAQLIKQQSNHHFSEGAGNPPRDLTTIRIKVNPSSVFLHIPRVSYGGGGFHFMALKRLLKILKWAEAKNVLPAPNRGRYISGAHRRLYVNTEAMKPE